MLYFRWGNLHECILFKAILFIRIWYHKLLSYNYQTHISTILYCWILYIPYLYLSDSTRFCTVFSLRIWYRTWTSSTIPFILILIRFYTVLCESDTTSYLLYFRNLHSYDSILFNAIFSKRVRFYARLCWIVLSDSCFLKLGWRNLSAKQL